MAKQNVGIGSASPLYARAVEKLKGALRGNSSAAVSMAVVDDEETQPLIIEPDEDAPFTLERNTLPLAKPLPSDEPDAARIGDIRDLDQARALVLIERASKRYQLTINPQSQPTSILPRQCNMLAGFCPLATNELERYLKACIGRGNVIKAVYVRPKPGERGDHCFVVMGRASARKDIAVMSEPVQVVDITWAQFSNATNKRIDEFSPQTLWGTIEEIGNSPAFKRFMEKEKGRTLLKRYSVGLWALTDPDYQCW